MPPRPHLTRAHFEVFLVVARLRSIQGAARESGRSRATVQRYLEDLRRAFDAPPLLERAPGQRRGVLTPAGHDLQRRVRRLLEHWDGWMVATRDALGQGTGLVVGTLAGSFDLLGDLLADLGRAGSGVGRVVELPDDLLVPALRAGEVDLAFGTRQEPVPRDVAFEVLGDLSWAVIVPASDAEAWPEEVTMDALAAVPMVLPRTGPARARLEEWFARAPGGPRLPTPAFEAGSTPRLVEMVTRGVGPAVVSRFRLAFLPEGVEARRVRGGPRPLTAGTYHRKGRPLSEPAAQLIARARELFSRLAT